MSRMKSVRSGIAVVSMLTWRRLPGSVAEHARRRSAARSLARPALHARVPESKWLARKDSNLRSPDPESGALPLGHSPVERRIVPPGERSGLPALRHGPSRTVRSGGLAGLPPDAMMCRMAAPRLRLLALLV